MRLSNICLLPAPRIPLTARSLYQYVLYVNDLQLLTCLRTEQDCRDKIGQFAIREDAYHGDAAALHCCPETLLNGGTAADLDYSIHATPTGDVQHFLGPLRIIVIIDEVCRAELFGGCQFRRGPGCCDNGGSQSMSDLQTRYKALQPLNLA